MSESQQKLSSYLEDGESLLWAGQPVPKLFQPLDKFLVPLSLLWCGGIVGIAASVLSADEMPPAFFVIFISAFLLFGLFLVAGRFVVRKQQMANTHYGITDRRVLSLHGVRKPTLRSRPREQAAEVVQRGDVGDVFFDAGGDGLKAIMERGDMASAMGAYTFMTDGRGFRGISDPHKVAALLTDTPNEPL